LELLYIPLRVVTGEEEMVWERWCPAERRGWRVLPVRREVLPGGMSRVDCVDQR
jgi:hypothetical protein